MSNEFQFGTFNGDETMFFNVDEDKKPDPGEVLHLVYDSLRQKGYNSINQLVGYLISGDPAYITNYNQSRTLIRRLDRDDIIEELLSAYLER